MPISLPRPCLRLHGSAKRAAEAKRIGMDLLRRSAIKSRMGACGCGMGLVGKDRKLIERV